MAEGGILWTASSLLQAGAALVKGVTHPTLPLRATYTHIPAFDDLPALARAGHTACVVKGRLYIFGGERIDESGAPTLADGDVHVVVLPSSGVTTADYRRIASRAASAPAGSSGSRPTSPDTEEGSHRGGDDAATTTSSSGGRVPAPRKNHSAAVVGDTIFIFGGEDATGQPPGPEDARGAVWAFDTVSSTWTVLEPAVGGAGTPPTSPAFDAGNNHAHHPRFPAPRASHAMTSSELPTPRERTADLRRYAPQRYPDPAKVVPEPPEPLSWGCLFVHAGRRTASSASSASADDELLNDVWTFNIRTRTWTSLPAPPGPGRVGASLAVVGDRLYRFGGADAEGRPLGDAGRAELEWLDVESVWMHAEKGTAALQSGWTWHAESGVASTATAAAAAGSEDTNPSHPPQTAPPPRSGAGVLPVTTGQGREYLLVIGGAGGAAQALDDAWAFQLPSAKETAALAKDVTRAAALRRETKEHRWAEVQYFHLDPDGEVRPVRVPSKGKDDAGADAAEATNITKGMGRRTRFAAAPGTEVDGATVVVWGGVERDPQSPGGDGEGVRLRTLGDGWMITVDR